ncbi:MAG: hypothetical protein F8N37_15725 [Telmatospirillum sp.]|nr:hypothetical protein [Telmatospirillum sp.]
MTNQETTPASDTQDSLRDGIIHSISVPRMARLLEKCGFVPQILRADDGRPAVRFMKLGMSGMVLMFGNSEAHPDLFRLCVLTAYLNGEMPADQINAISARGVLPKIYIRDKTTVVELCIPVEAGLSEEAVLYFVSAFEAFLKAA